MLPSLSGKVDHTHFGPEGNNVAVLKPVINRDGASHEPAEHGLCHLPDQSILQRARGLSRACDDVGLQPMHGDCDFPSCNQPTQAARMVRVGVGDDHHSYLSREQSHGLQPL